MFLCSKSLGLIVGVVYRSVFHALVAAIYLTLGMPEVYRVLFEVFGFDVDAPDCQPKPRTNFEDVDHLSPELDGERLTWQDIAYYQVFYLQYLLCSAYEFRITERSTLSYNSSGVEFQSTLRFLVSCMSLRKCLLECILGFQFLNRIIISMLY